jgi:hypothetical protein
MSEKIEFILELTREEALGLALLAGSMWGRGFRYETVCRIANALSDLDPSLHQKQLDMWEINYVSATKLIDSVPLPKGWV